MVGVQALRKSHVLQMQAVPRAFQQVTAIMDQPCLVLKAGGFMQNLYLLDMSAILTRCRGTLVSSFHKSYYFRSPSGLVLQAK